MEKDIVNDCVHIELLAKSAAKIASYNFTWQYVTLLLMNSTLFCGINSFLEYYNKTTVIATENLIPHLNEHSRQFVLFGNNLRSILDLVLWISYHEYDSTGKFIIICQSILKKDCDEIEAVNIFWNYKIVNIIYINYKQNYGAMGYSYDYGKNCQNGPPVLLKNWDNCINTDRNYCRKKYPIKLQNLHGCPVIVSTFMQKPYMNFSSGVPTGADGDLLNIIIEALNARLILMTPWRGDGWGNLDQNGTWVGSLGDLYYDLANFSMTSASITQTRHRDFHISKFYYTVNVGWVTHPPEKEMSSYKLLRPYKVDVRIAILISFGIVICIVLFLKTKICALIFKKFSFGRSPTSVLFLSWEICMGQPTLILSSKMALSYLVIIWIWYCFLMRTFYQVHLINCLKNDVYLADLTSIEDAIKENYPYGGGTALKDYYIDQPLVYYNWKQKYSSQYEEIMLNLTKGMKFLLAMNLATAKEFLKKPGRKLHILPQTIVSCPSVIFFKKFSPFTKPINRILDRLVEFGWPNMLFRNYTTTVIQNAEDEDKPITLKELLPVKTPILEDIGRVTAKIAYYNFDWRYVTLVMYSSLQNVIVLETFLKWYSQSVILKLGKFIPHRRFTIPQFVIFGEDSNELVDAIIWLDKCKYDNSGKYIIICTSNEYRKCDPTQVFLALSRVLIINIIYITLKSDTEYELYSYDIILPGNCKNSEPYKLHIDKSCTEEECFKTLYTKKIKNFYKCPLFVSTFEQPPFMYINNETSELSGGDGEIIKFVAHKLNATLRVKIPEGGNDWGHYQDNNWTGSLGDVYNNLVHISVRALPLSEYTYGNFTSSFVYNSMDIVWTAAMPMLKPSWQKLLNPVDTSIRIGLFLMFAGIALVNSATKLDICKRIRTAFKIGPLTSSLLFYSWALFLGIPILKMPTKQSLLILVYSWIGYCFVIRNAYQAALMGSLKTQVYEDYFYTFDSVIKGRYPYGGFANLREYYAEDAFIYENWEIMEFNQAYEILDKISNRSSDFVLALNKENIIQFLVDGGDNRRVQILPQKIVNSPLVMYFKKHSIFAPSVNHILRTAVEAGFTQIMHNRYLRHKKYLFQMAKDNYYDPLTLDNFKSCMFLLVFGWFLALIFFVAEAYFGHLEDDEF
ncbi:unnamed protein product, partial [Brenthis ino]